MQEMVQEIDHVVSENGHNLDAVNIATALHQLEHAYSIVAPEQENYALAERLLHELIKLGTRQMPEFKIDSVIMTVSAIAKLAAQGPSRVPFPSPLGPQGVTVKVSASLLISFKTMTSIMLMQSKLLAHPPLSLERMVLTKPATF